MTATASGPPAAALVDALVLERDSRLATARDYRRAADSAVARFDMRAERLYRSAHDQRLRALLCQHRLDALAGRGTWSTLADLRGPQ